MAATMAAIMEITENIMRRMHEPSTKLHNALYFMSGMMVVILALVIVAGVKTKAENAGFHIADDTENSYEQQVAGQTDTTQDSGQEKWQEGVVAYQGKEYLYNTDIKTYLMMGVDIDGPVQQSSDYTQGGQSDALFLLVVNNKTEQLQVISINRNTMADIELCDEEGIDMGPLKTQICLQHAFGDGKRLSCSKTVDAVSGLFQNIPISGYLAMNMGGIPQMNDAVGGVEVTVQQDISFPKAGVNLKKGQKVTLNGMQAYYYLHGRDTEEYDSATKRLQREEQYIVAYMDKLKKVSTENPDQVTEIYNSVSDYLVTSVDFTSMIEQLMNYGFSEDQMYTVPGKTVEGKPIDGKRYEEYHVDEDAMEELIMKVFYTPVQ
ncbi:LCP family protein [Roseburia faecis]|uniref:LCP family protein n=1 Tax=Roseburia faecis TaxID=301302 RepID=UPI0032BF90C4